MTLTIQVVRDNISLLISDSGVMSMRAMAYRLRLMTTMFSLCLFSVPTIVLSPQALSAEGVVQSSGQPSAESIKALAKAFTVKVFAGQQRGSGVILAKSGQRYTVVTNAHVIDRGNPYRIQTPDGNTYTAVLKSKGDTFKGNDLAVLEFTAAANYQVAQWGDSGAIKGAERLFAAGFPEGENQLSVSTGQVSLIAEKALLGGYRIGFSNETRQGMSGGALLNAQGKVIGILGQGNQAILERAYTYQDGSKPTAKVLQQMRESSFAVPIATVRQMVPPAKIAQTPLTLQPPPPPPLPLPSNPSFPPNPPQPSQNNLFIPSFPNPKPTPSKPNQVKPTYTGVLGEVDKIAEQITVRIQGKEHGSGVIVARQGDTYTVLTAKHVVKDPGTYRVITADGKEYAITPTTIRYKKENLAVDIAVLQFRSSNSYQVAKLGTAQLKGKTRVFISGFPSNQLPQRVLTTGRSVLKEQKELAAKESYSLVEGKGLLYTCLSIGGMSGGPVLDGQGRVVAINTGTEDYSVRQEIDGGLQLGYSLGVPIDTFTGILGQFAVQAQQLTVERTQPKEISAAEHQRIRTQLRTMKSPGQGGTAMDWLNYGNQLYRLEDYDEAITAAERVIQLKPDFYYAYYLKGLTLIQSGRFREALIAFEEATRIPNFYPAWRWKSLTLSNAFSKYDEALLAIKKAIEVAGGCNVTTAEAAGSCVTLYLEQGNVLKELKRYQEALDSYSRAISLNPDFAIAYNNRGNAYNDLKQYDKALVDYNKAITLNPDYADAYYNRGTNYSALNQYDKALVDYNKVIVLQPDYAKAYNNRGTTYRNLKQYDKAIIDLNKAIILQPDLADAYYSRGTTYSDLKQYDEALVDYDKAIILQPDFTKAYNNRGATYSDLKQYDKALVDLNKAIMLQPDYAEAYYNRGNAYKSLKQYDKALVDYNKAILLQSDFAEAYNNRGATYSDLKQYDKAMLDLQKAYLLAQQQNNITVAQIAQRGIELLQSNK